MNEFEGLDIMLGIKMLFQVDYEKLEQNTTSLLFTEFNYEFTIDSIDFLWMKR